MMPLVRAVTRRLRPVTHPARPAISRIGVGLFSGIHNLRRRPTLRNLHRQDPSRFAPVGVVRVLRRPLPPRVADALFDAAQLANAAATLGIAHRITGPLNAALQLWTISYRNSWGMIFHNDNTLTMHQVVLGTSRAADAWSVDALLARRPAQPARHYGGIATAMNVATCAVYLISGVAKVRSPRGWAWASGDTLRDQIAADAIRKESFGTPAPRLAAATYRSQTQIGLLAAGALAVELGAPLSLIDRRLGYLFAVAAWGMHVGIRVIMGIKFSYNTSGVAYLPYVTNVPALSAVPGLSRAS
ncbi:hypothetical protein [Gulosibacter faecalis]|jgi:hypothetical protein|uniref:HTTM domain-containing protein n=1 Tax=Gulosibacter faecalis TaxID=272240 RepID=A0ABW5UUM9_9MICO|nr:hypothetical protein [Gulosibacter faecalis]